MGIRGWNRYHTDWLCQRRFDHVTAWVPRFMHFRSNPLRSRHCILECTTVANLLKPFYLHSWSTTACWDAAWDWVLSQLSKITCQHRLLGDFTPHFKHFPTQENGATENTQFSPKYTWKKALLSGKGSVNRARRRIGHCLCSVSPSVRVLSATSRVEGCNQRAVHLCMIWRYPVDVPPGINFLWPPENIWGGAAKSTLFPLKAHAIHVPGQCNWYDLL